MPPRAIKHQLTCPIKLTSGSFLIGRRGILVIPRNRLIPHSSSSVFSNNHSAMYLIIINLNPFFKATGITKSSYISILHQFKMGQNKPFTAVCHMKTDFYKIYKSGCSGKYSNYENSMLHHCCEQCQVKSIVLQMCLQTIKILQCSFK